MRNISGIFLYFGKWLKRRSRFKIFLALVASLFRRAKQFVQFR